MLLLVRLGPVRSDYDYCPGVAIEVRLSRWRRAGWAAGDLSSTRGTGGTRDSKTQHEQNPRRHPRGSQFFILGLDHGAIREIDYRVKFCLAGKLHYTSVEQKEYPATLEQDLFEGSCGSSQASC